MKRQLQSDRSLQWVCRTTFLTLVFLCQSACQFTWAGTFPAENSRDVRRIKAEIRAAQFLSKATFGPTQEAITELANRISRVGYKRACGEWIDQQFALPMSSQEQVARDIIALNGREPDMSGVSVHLYRYQAWWHIALTGDDQLRQRVAWALSQIFVIGDSAAGFNNPDKRSIGDNEFSKPDWIGMSDYYDMLAGHATGNYRDLLEDVTFHPCMGIWLSSLHNRKGDIAAGRYPDENYAREIMQLFSIGLYQLHQDGRPKKDENGALIPTYDNEGIKELARVFTGFQYHHNTSANFGRPRNFGDPMGIDQRFHDNNYDYSEDPNNPGQIDPNEEHSKTILGVTLDPLPQPLTNDAARAEIGQALDVIANHPNVGPFICRLLIQRLVKSNPSRAYIRRVSRVFNNNGRGVRGDMQAVVKAILLDPELFRSQRAYRRTSPLRVEVKTRGTEFCRTKEPINRITAMIRALKPSSNYDGGYMMLSHSIESDLGQLPFRSQTVFNYYLPDYQPPGNLTTYTPSRRNPYGAAFAPELQLLNGVTANKTINEIKQHIRQRYVQFGMRVGTCRITFNLNEELEMMKNLGNIDELLERYDLLLCNGTLTEDTKAVIKSSLTAEPVNLSSTNDERLEELLLAILISPDCVIEE